MVGIYKITNTVNNKAYIGLSKNIENRWNAHKTRYKAVNDKEYNKALYHAMRYYGLDKFQFTVIEECSEEELNMREIYWIAYYDTYHNGYNETPGGEIGNLCHGETHPRHKLSEADVIAIRQLWASCSISTQEMYLLYQDKIAKTGFKKIYTWQTWKNILPELNTEECRAWHRNNIESYCVRGEKNKNSRITDEEYKDIKQRYFENGESLKEIAEDYLDRYSNVESFRATMYNRFRSEQRKPVSTIPVVGE